MAEAVESRFKIVVVDYGGVRAASLWPTPTYRYCRGILELGKMLPGYLVGLDRGAVVIDG